MVYRDLDMETAEKRHSEATDAPPAPPAEETTVKVGVRRKVVKVLVPKSK